MNIFEVGGTIRDALLGLKNKDRDFAVEAESYDAMKEEFLARGGTIYLERPQFFAIRGKLPEIGDADYVLCRRDGFYSDGRHPDSVEIGTIFDDLARRDFTSGAMAKNIETGEIIDPFNGKADTLARILRCVGDTEKRMEEDALRMLRAIRFNIVKKFSLDSDIYLFLRDERNAELLNSVSVERIREELLKCFDCDTLATLEMLRSFPALEKNIFARNLKLTPTIFVRK
jgi:tRNA nucleotidyltransferase (CCA-adding enzyme)